MCCDPSAKLQCIWNSGQQLISGVYSMLVHILWALHKSLHETENNNIRKGRVCSGMSYMGIHIGCPYTSLHGTADNNIRRVYRVCSVMSYMAI